jgi:branched-chain amino acid transport system permease protein
LVLLLASLGIYVVVQNLIAVIFGADMKTIHGNLVSEGLPILGARITPIQIAIIAVSAGLVVITYLLLKMTLFGKAVRAVASDSALAATSGIDAEHVMLCAFALASALAGAAGVLVALDVDMTPTMGLNALMMGVVSAIIGGMRSVPGIALASLLLSFAQHLGAWEIGSQWQDATAFVILLAFLLVRPEGVLGKKLRKATA